MSLERGSIRLCVCLTEDFSSVSVSRAHRGLKREGGRRERERGRGERERERGRDRDREIEIREIEG